MDFVYVLVLTYVQNYLDVSNNKYPNRKPIDFKFSINKKYNLCICEFNSIKYDFVYII